MASEVNDIFVSDEAFAYLAVQRGRIAQFSSNFAEWLGAYRESLLKDYLSMLPFLPETCGCVLDVGSGLGGINILLNRHYGSDLTVHLMDGDGYEPEVERHNIPFNDMRVAADFLRQNGVERAIFSTPDRLQAQPTADLVISTFSWCFHLPPDPYLAFVKQCAKPGAVVIVDVRNGKKDWYRALDDAMGMPLGIVASHEKFTRYAFKV